MDNDGRDDILVGACWESSVSLIEDAGRAYAFSSGTGSLLHAMDSPNPELRGFFGASVAGAGDLNSDERPEILISGVHEDPHGLADEGAVHIYDGLTGELLRTLYSPNPQSCGYFGRSISSISDLDNDSIDDLLIGAPGEGFGEYSLEGRAYAVSGSSGTIIHALISPQMTMEELFGSSVASIGDINSDNISDFVIGARVLETGSNLSRSDGHAYVFDGATGTHLHTLQSANPESENQFGASVAGGGDFNADGCPDIIVAAYRENLNSELQDAGRVYVFSGATGQHVSTLISPNSEYYGSFGRSVCCIHDLNSRYGPGVIIGAPHEDPDLSPLGAGRTYLFTPGLHLKGRAEGMTVILSWTPIVAAHSYWLYGTTETSYILPQLQPPFDGRLQVLSPGISSLTWNDAVGDPMTNWSFILVAIDTNENPLALSNLVGEFDTALSIPLVR